MTYSFLKKMNEEERSRGMDAPRAYFIPFSRKNLCTAADPMKEVSSSDRVFSLSGEWDFALTGGTTYSFDTESMTQKTVVPSFWKIDDGSNDPYYYKKSVRRPPQKAVYRTFFTVYNPEDLHFIQFTRVSGPFEVYVNGNLCGVSQIGEGEFNVTPFIQGENNELVVVVHAYGTGDVFFANGVKGYGICGDVLHIVRPTVFLADYAFNSYFDSLAYVGDLSVAFYSADTPFTAKITLCDGDKVLEERETSNQTDSITFSDRFSPYSTEDPKLYDLYVQIFVGGVEKECSRLRVGFFDRKPESGFTYCQRPLKLMSVLYRSVFLPDGQIMGIEDHKKELRLLKKCGLNCIVTPQPMEPEFIRLCTEMGLFVIDGFGFSFALPKKGKGYRKKLFRSQKATDYLKEIVFSRIVRDRSQASVIGFYCGEEKVECLQKATEGLTFATQFMLSAYTQTVTLCPFEQSSENQSGPVFLTLPWKPIREEYVACLSAVGMLPNAYGCCLGDSRDVTLGDKVFSDGGIFNAEYREKSISEIVRYTLRPFTSSLRENSFLDIRNNGQYASARATVVVSLHMENVVRELRRFSVDIPANSTSTYNLRLTNIETGTEMEVSYWDEEGNHIVSEFDRVYEDNTLPDISSLTCQTFTCTLHPLDEVAEENTVELRSRLSPCSSVEVCDIADTGAATGHKSDRTLSLAGPWQFRYYNEKIPSAILTEGNWDVVTVPGTWESSGYEELSFVKGYAFPYLKKKNKFQFTKDVCNTLGVYRKIVNVADLSFRHFLYFESLSGAIQLFVNGIYVGCSSYRTAEFDISSYLSIGENEIVVAMKKWSRNSFIYAEDGFAATGILGDVLLIKSHKKGLFDCKIETHASNNTFFAEVGALFLEKGAQVCLQVKKDDKILHEEKKEVIDNIVKFHCNGNWKPYFDENPELYDFYLTVYVNDRVVECTKQKVGLTDIRRANGVVYYNGLPLKLRGVVYNPVYNRQGKFMTIDEYKKDLDLIKKFGFNAVQPTFLPTAAFLNACLEKGVYVMDRIPVGEAYTSGSKRNAGVWDQSDFADRVKMQTQTEFKRTHLYCNVLGYVIDADGSAPAISGALSVFNGITDRIVSARGMADGIFGMSDPTVNDFMDKVDESMGKNTVLLLDYAHSYGIGCPDLERFEETISASSCCVGGFIARFVDDTIGDVGERDDGLFTVERIPCTGAENAAYIYRKVTGNVLSDSQIEITNGRLYKDTSDLMMKVCIQKDGKVLSRTELVATIPPHSKRVFDIFVDHVEGDMFLNVEYWNKETKELLYTEQHRLSQGTVKMPGGRGEKLRVDEFPDYLDITFNGGKMRFDKVLGTFTHYSIKGKEVFKPDRLANGGNCFVGNVDRPFIRHLLANDTAAWTRSLRDFSWTKGDDGSYVDILVETSLILGKKECYVIRDKYLIGGDGRIEVFSVINTMKRHLPNLDCFGKKIRLHNGFGNVTYYGLGERECYVDMCQSARMGLFTFGADKIFNGINVVQECGNRMDVQYALIRDKEGDGIMCVAEKEPFQLRVSPYSDEEIKKIFDGMSVEQSGIYLDVCSFVSGYGVNKGVPAKKFTYMPGEYLLHFSILPIFGGNR